MGDLRFFLGRERGPVTKHGVRNAGALEEVDERAWRHGALQAGGRRPVTASPRVRNRSRVRGIICRSWGPGNGNVRWLASALRRTAFAWLANRSSRPAAAQASEGWWTG